MPMPEFKELIRAIRPEVEEINVVDLSEMQQSNEDFLLIDIREPYETAEGMIPGAVAIPRGVLELDIDKQTTDTNKQIVLYCEGGGRSILAAYMLGRMGFQNVISLLGGYKQWNELQQKINSTKGN